MVIMIVNGVTASDNPDSPAIDLATTDEDDDAELASISAISNGKENLNARHNRYSVVDRRQSRQHKRFQCEELSLLGEDSDLERNINRLCQYLSGSDNDEHEKEGDGSSSVAYLPTKRATPLKSRHRSRLDSSTSSTSEGNLSVNSSMPTVAASDGLMVPMQRLVPRDFLNIPPPAHPPPIDDGLSDRPLPPKRNLPPVPAEEPHYEEAKPAPAPPPPPMPRSSKQPMSCFFNENGNTHSRPQLGKASAVVSPLQLQQQPPQSVALSSKTSSLTQPGQYDDIDWHNYETSVLAQTETGSFYIPSGQTTMSSISPSRKSEIEQNKHNYSLLPNAQTTVPLPIGSEFNGSKHRLHSTSTGHSVHSRIRKREDLSRIFCSWRCCTYALGAVLLFSLAVICYLLVMVLTTPAASSVSQPPVLPYEPSGFGGSSASSVETTSKLSLRPLPESFSLGDDVLADLPPRQLSHTYFALQRSAYVQFNVSVDPQAKLAFYGRQTLPPSPTEHDFSNIVLGVKLHAQRRSETALETRQKRDSVGLPANFRSTVFVQYLSGGKWRLAILNDGNDVRSIKFSVSLTDSHREECKNNCNNKGVCKEGKCYCFDGFTGAYCEETFCPILCSGNGLFANGQCHCHEGWKGSDCDVRSNICEVPNCNGRGQCNSKGECVCDKGYKGLFCEQLECPNENCSGHGVCYNGKCFCDFGYKGDSCDIVYTSEGLCTSTYNRCNGRGRFDPRTNVCQCDNGWTGDSCEKSVCQLNCGERGKCIDGSCVCDDGWTGERCRQVACRDGCEENGKCDNGVCICNDGWHGENCQLLLCPNFCSRRGECKKSGSKHQCVCPPDFGGEDCSVPKEIQCSDEIDNDADGLVDCEDSDCCSNARCKDGSLCRTVPDPYQVLIRKQSPPPQSSFYQKAAFLLDTESVQQYADSTLFSESRISIVRGRVLNNKGGPLVAVRVANAANPLFGFTLTREGGLFDLVVDGGGAITLTFMRQPFNMQYMTVVIPWNEIVYVGDVTLLTKNDAPVDGKSSDSRWSERCLTLEKEQTFKPYATPSWKYGRRGTASSLSGIVVDAWSVQESLQIPGTDVYLTYSSSYALGHQSTVMLYLLPEKILKDLRLVRLTVDVEGIHFETVLEAKANLTYVYGWNKRNIYNQRVTGLVTAKIRVGYVYAKCERTFWESISAKLQGHTDSISEIGGWNLNIHHRYNVLDSILEKGDGAVVFLREEPPMLVNTLGSKGQRILLCAAGCNGPASSAELYSPVAIATARDGSIYIGDSNLIRRVWKNTVTAVLELNIADTAHQYYMAIHPVSGEVYVSLPLRRQVWKVRSLSNATVVTLSTNYDVVVGSGEICGSDGNCGDGGPAEVASLTFPKGITFDTQGNLYIADHRRIRRMSISGFMSTLIGATADESTSGWIPLSCSTTFDRRSFRLQWPTSLAYDFLNERLLFLDTEVVYEVSAEHNLVSVRAGAPGECSHLLNYRNETVRPILLKGATAIAVADNGLLLISETDRKRMHRVRSVDSHGQVKLLAGVDSKCDCHRHHCPCDDQESVVEARDAHLHDPISLAVDPSGNIHVADQGNRKIRTIRFALPSLDPITRLYEILAPDSHEIYYFNRFGQHVATKNMISNQFVFNFTYHLDTSYGKLNKINSAEGQIYIIRKSTSKVLIETMNRLASTAQISRYDMMLERFTTPEGATSEFDYEGNSGLLTNKTDPTGKSWTYDYNEFGHVRKAVSPTGEIRTINYDLNRDRMLVNVQSDNQLNWQLTASESEITVSDGIKPRSIALAERSLFYIRTPGNVTAQYDGGVNALAEGPQLTVLRRKLTLPATSEPPRPELTSKLEWRYYWSQSSRNNYKRVVQVGRRTRVNGASVLTVEFDREKNFDLILNQNSEKILTVFYGRGGHVTQWAPADSTVAVLNATYDQMSRIISHSWGTLNRAYAYDLEGRMIEMGDKSDAFPTVRKYEYSAKAMKPSAVELPSGTRYRLTYGSSGRVTGVTAPSGQASSYKQQNGANAIHYLYSSSTKNSCTLTKRGDGLITSTLFGDGAKRVDYVYDRNSRLLQKIHDNSQTEFSYDEETGSLMSVTQKAGNSNQREVKFGYQGSLIVESVDRRYLKENDPSPLSTSVFYQYDENFRVKLIQAIFDGDAPKLCRLEYDSLTGRPLSVDGYEFQYRSNSVRMSNERSAIETTLTPNLAIGQTSYSVKGRVVVEQQSFYDTNGRLLSVTSKMGADQGGLQYDYNSDGQVTAAKIMLDGIERSFKYQYDVDGGLKQVNTLNIISENGRVTKYGESSYTVDENGFVTGRDDETFIYDSFGRLVGASAPKKYDNRYSYDEHDRLIGVNRSGKSLQFYYTLPHKPRLITHIYAVDDRTLSLLIYDQNDRLAAIETNGVFRFVVCLPDSTPVYLFGDDNSLIKTVVRSPFGVVEVSSSPELMLLIGYKGHYQDIDNGVVIFESGRPYDPKTGRWMAARPEDLFNVDVFHPEAAASPFVFMNPVNQMAKLDYDINDWLRFVGYDVDSLMPLLSPRVGPTFQCVEQASLIISGECRLRKKVESFHTLLSVKPSPLLHDSRYTDKTCSVA